jgi:hypothetical protein
MGIKVRNDVKVYEVGGGEVGPGEPVEMQVLSHSRSGMIIIAVPGAKNMTVSGSDLQKAITNALNSTQY